MRKTLAKKASVFLCAAVFAAALHAPAARAQFTEFNAFKEPQTGGGSGAVTGPDLKPTADKFEGGKITIGATAYVVATFKNSGSSPVKVTGINLYPSSTVAATVNLNKCAEAPLPPDAVCAVTVAVTGLQPGTWRVSMLLDHDGRSRLATAALSGDVETGAAGTTTGADIEANPADLDFGSATGGVPLVRSLLLHNLTGDKIDISSVNLDAPDQSGFTVRPECPPSLASGESCVVNVIWVPVARGDAQAVLRINHSGKSRVTKVDVKGSFAPASSTAATIYPDAASDMGLLVTDMDKVDFGAGISNVAAITVSLVNKGSADLTLKSISLAGSDNGISIARAGCKAGLTLKSGAACALTVNWVPSRAGSVLDDLQILHTGARGVLVLPIRGTADAAATRGSISMRPSAALPPDGADAGKTDGEKPAPRTKEEKEDSLSASNSGITPVLDGYVVTSHSPTKAVINGPVGSLVVRDGEDAVISGVRWTVTIVSTGVILSSDSDEILLVFDKALRAMTPASSSSSSSTSSAGSASSTSSSTSSSAQTPAATNSK